MAEIVKAENDKEIAIEFKNGASKIACLYDNDVLLAENRDQINRYFARAINTALYGKSLQLFLHI